MNLNDLCYFEYNHFHHAGVVCRYHLSDTHLVDCLTFMKFVMLMQFGVFFVADAETIIDIT